jgi:hypothetical protein
MPLSPLTAACAAAVGFETADPIKKPRRAGVQITPVCRGLRVWQTQNDLRQCDPHGSRRDPPGSAAVLLTEQTDGSLLRGQANA